MARNSRRCWAAAGAAGKSSDWTPPVRSGVSGRLLALAVLILAAMPVSAQRDGRQLKDFRAEAEALDRQDPFANAYRAGHYSGYLAGILDALQGRSVCFSDCPCEVDKLVGQYLAEHAAADDRPVAEWLVPLLEERYPCK